MIRIMVTKITSHKTTVQKAVEILKNGGIVVFPTDTAFGVGCRIDDEVAIARLLKLKRRPENQAAPVLVDSIETAQKYLLSIPEEVLKLMRRYWPGALTIVRPCRVELVPKSICGGGLTLGVRWPGQAVVCQLIKKVGVPILGPSANFHGAPTPYKFSDLDPEFLKGVDLVLNMGESMWCKPSTVIDCSKKPWRIIRQGAIKIALSMEKILLIDTSDREKTVVGLRVDGKTYRLTGKRVSSQILLPLIDKILKRHHLKIQDLTGVEVDLGPGSFTGLRVGVAVANTLGTFLKIPINRKRVGNLASPMYQ